VIPYQEDSGKTWHPASHSIFSAAAVAKNATAGNGIFYSKRRPNQAVFVEGEMPEDLHVDVLLFPGFRSTMIHLAKRVDYVPPSAEERRAAHFKEVDRIRKEASDYNTGKVE
jgi:hypothetical protein